MSSTTPPPHLGPISATLVSFIGTVLDDNGAWEWDYRIVATVTSLTLFAIKLLFDKRGGIDWYAFFHALVSGTGAAICVYLNFFASEQIAGTPEPLLAVQCGDPLTSLHRIIPAITMGYAILDVVDGLTIGLDFLLHGLATLAIMAFFCEHDKPQFVTPMLVMECSTIFLTVVRAKFFPEWLSALNQACFVLAFFVCRVLIFPKIWSDVALLVVQHASTSEFQACFPWYFPHVVVSFGAFFNCLNAFWFYKLIKKVIRKLNGTEKVNELNELADPNARNGKKKA